MLTQDKKGKVQLHAERYEYWLYRQCRKRLLFGELHLDDSTRHRSLERELISSQKQAELLPRLTLPRLQTPIYKTLKQLSHELNSLWKTFNRKLKKGEFKHLLFDKATGQLSFKKLKINDNEDSQQQFYSKLPSVDITSVLQFVNEQCHFLKVFKPLKQPNSKKLPRESELFAIIMAEAMNHSLPKMASISDIPYHRLDDSQKQYLRLATLKAANDIISNRIKALGIFPYYELGFDKRYGSCRWPKI